MQLLNKMDLPNASAESEKKSSQKTNANCNQVILDHFWNVCGASIEKRCRSIQVILNTLSHQVKNDFKNDIQYCLERLIRGLTSTREFAPHGFSVLLTKIMATFSEHCSINDMLTLANKEYGQKLADSDPKNAIAWSLFLGCTIKSGLITPQTDEEIVTKIVNNLFILGTKKYYLETFVCQLLPILYDIFLQDEHKFKQIILPILTSYEDHKNSTFFAYAVLLAFEKYSSLSDESMVGDYVRVRFLSTNQKDYSNVVALLKDSTRYLPNIHPIVGLLMETIARLDPDNFSTFCSVVMENIFDGPLEKISLGFELVRILLPLSNIQQISLVLSPTVVRLLIQSLSSQKHPLHNSAIELSKHLVTYSASIRHDSALQIAFAKCFLNKPGAINFDELSKSKLLTSVLKNFDNEAIRIWVLMLKDTMLTQIDIPSSDFYRIRALQQMCLLLKSYTVVDDFLWQMSNFFFAYAYFNTDKCKGVAYDNISQQLPRFQSTLTDKLEKQFADSFKTVFAHLIILSTNGVFSQHDKLLKQVQVVSTLVEFCLTLLKMKQISLLGDNQSKLTELKETANAMKAKVEKIDKLANSSVKANIFKLLYLHFIIELFENGDEIIAISADLDECAQRSLYTSESKKSKVDDPLWSDVLTDLFLSLLTTKSKYTKNIVVNAFRHISPFVSSVGIQRLIEAVLNADSLSSDDEEDIENEEMQSEHDTQTDQDIASEQDEEDSDSDSDEDIMNNDNDQVDEKFRNDVMKALGKAAEPSNETEDVNELCESEMLQIDDQLAEVFRQKFGEKKRQNEKQSMIVMFKLRALELIGILVEHNELSLDTYLELVISILMMVRPCYAHKNMQPFTNKCISILESISKKKRSFTIESSQKKCQEVAENVLSKLLEFQYKCTNSTLRSTLTKLTGWLVHVFSSQGIPLQKFHTALQCALKDCFDRSNIELNSELFARVVPLLCQAESKPFFESDYYNVLHQYCTNNELRPFKRKMAIELLNSLMRDTNCSKQQVQDVISKLAVDFTPGTKKKKTKKGGKRKATKV